MLIGQGGIKLHSAKLGGKENGWLSPEGRLKALPSPIEQFTGNILQGEPIYFGMEDAVALTQMMESAYTSHKEKRHILL